MKRRQLIQQGGLAGILATGVAPAMAQGLPEVKWRLSASWPKSLDTLYGVCENVSKRVAELTGGRFMISSFAAGEIVGGLQILDAVQNLSVEAGHTAPYYFFGKDETFALGCAIPFGLNSRQMTAWMVEGNGLKLMREFYAKYNIISFPGGNTGAQMGGWFRKPIKSLADFKGTKFRVGGFAGKVVERIGENCEPSLVSVLFLAGAGGSLRAGVTDNPIRLTRAERSASERDRWNMEMRSSGDISRNMSTS